MTDLTVTGTLTVDQGSTFREDVFIAGGCSLGPSAFQGTMSVLETTTFEGTLNVDGLTNVAGPLVTTSFSALKDISVSQNFVGTSLKSFGNVTCTTISVGSDANIISSAALKTLIAGQSNVLGPVSANKLSGTSAQSNTATARTVITSTHFATTGSTAVNSDFSASGGLTIASNLSCQNQLTVGTALSTSSGGLSVSGSLAVQSNTTVSGVTRISNGLIVFNQLRNAQQPVGPPSATGTLYNLLGNVLIGGTVTLSPGSADSTGVIVLKYNEEEVLGPNTTGTVTFATPFDKPPLVRLQIQDVWSTNPFQVPGNQPVFDLTSLSTTGFTFVLRDGGALLKEPNFTKEIVYLAVQR